MVTKKQLEMAVKSLNNATYEEDGGQKDIIDTKVLIGNNEAVDIDAFMKACESIPPELEERIPDLVADIYNDLKDELESEKKTDIDFKSEKISFKKRNDPVKFTRGDSLIAALKIGGNQDAIITNMDAIYGKNGGKCNSKESKWLFKIITPILIKTKTVNLIDGKFQVNF